METPAAQNDPRVYFAAERTFLAWIRTGLVALGVVINLVAVFNHLSVVKKLSSGTWQPGHPSRTAVALGLLLAAIGIAMAVYLITIR